MGAKAENKLDVAVMVTYLVKAFQIPVFTAQIKTMGKEVCQKSCNVPFRIGYMRIDHLRHIVSATRLPVLRQVHVEE